MSPIVTFRSNLRWWAKCVIIFNALLDFEKPWAFPWNWRPQAKFEDACSDPEGLRAESNASAGIEVVMPSVGQTGTTTLTLAMHQLGFRTYDTEDRIWFARPTLEADVSLETWTRHMSRCRVEALSLEPLTDTLPLAIAASPRAKFIMTWRSYADWSRSHRNGGFVKDLLWQWVMVRAVASSARMGPWLELWDLATGDFTRILREGHPYSHQGLTSLRHLVGYYVYARCGFFRPANDVWNRGSSRIAGDEDGYLAHLEEVHIILCYIMYSI